MCEMDTVYAGKVYRHFKGTYYQIIAIAEDANTGEKLVIYQSLGDPKSTIWSRPLSEFMEELTDVYTEEELMEYHKQYGDVVTNSRYRFNLVNPQKL